MKRFLCAVMTLLMLLSAVSGLGETTDGGKTLKILFTHDIHSYFDVAEAIIGGVKREHGGAARLKTLIDQNMDENTIYVDAGDFSMGTLLQAGFATDAYELRLLGLLGCEVTTFGNHEFDYGGYGAAKMLESALASGDPLPKLVTSNISFDGELTDEQQAMKNAIDDFGARNYVIIEKNGLKVAFFGLVGIDGVECAPTSGMNFENYIEAAKRTVQAINEEGADVIVCLSHCGTEGDGTTGEDFDLCAKVPAIDVIISGHSHSEYTEPQRAGNTLIVSAGEYLANLGSLTLNVSGDSLECADYRLIPCDGSVASDPDIAEKYAEFKNNIAQTYLKEYDCDYDQVICRSDFDFMTLGEMYATHQEYPMGDLIADSYIYEAQLNGIDDIDVALVGLGTIRGSFFTGDITVADAFEICSLGVGADGSAGHPLLACYITGRELKLLTELDASLGPKVSSIKMSYSGLSYTFNTKRILLDRVCDVQLVRDGELEEIENDRLYKIACNMYAANMLGMLNGLTKGILAIVPKDAEGNTVTDLYEYALKDKSGREIKEWVALKDYLGSFPTRDGVPIIPEAYAGAQDRKVKISKGGFAVIANPGIVTTTVIALPIIIIAVIVTLCLTRKKRKAKRALKKSKS